MLSSLASTVGRKVNMAKLISTIPKTATIDFFTAAIPTTRSIPAARTLSSLLAGHQSSPIKDMGIAKSKISTPKKVTTFLDTFGTQMVDIYVGAQWQHFRVHKKLLCERISYFKELVGNSAYVGYAAFPNEHPESFDALLGWVYTGNLRELSNPTSVEESQPAWIPLKLYALAHKFSVPELMDEVMDQWSKRDRTHQCLPYFEVIDEVYSTLPAGSRPRKYVSWVVYSITRREYKDPLWPVEKIRKLMEKHPDLKADFAQYLEEEKVCFDQEKDRAQHFQKARAQEQVVKQKEASRTLDRQGGEEHDSGICHRACTEAFAG